MRRKLVFSILVLFLGIQFLPYGRLPAGPPDSLAALELEEPLASAIRTACFDCHARERPAPWYGRVAPFSWWITREKRWAQGALDFSRWPEYSPRQQRLIWERSLLRVSAGSMPPLPYHLVHPTLSDEMLLALRKHLESLETSGRQLEKEELMAWPSAPWSGGPVREVVRAEELDLKEPLLLQGGLLLVQGDLRAPFGLRGHGAILCAGEVLVSGIDQSVGPLVLLGQEGVSLAASRPVTWHGQVSGRGRLTTEQVRIQDVPDLRMTFADVREALVHYCRDDGEIGEYAERMLVVRYKNGEYVLWDPEFSAVARAEGLEQALAQVEGLLARDRVMDLEVWSADFRAAWQRQLSALPSEGWPASLSPEAVLPSLDRPKGNRGQDQNSKR